MTDKSLLGRLCEFIVTVIVRDKTGWTIENLNDTQINHPVTDLRVVNPLRGEAYEISVKAKIGSENKDWPKVKGISSSGQYIVFVSVDQDRDPRFYILDSTQWNDVLIKIKKVRDPGSKKSIKNGALELRWEDRYGKQVIQRGSRLFESDISEYRDAWSTLPGARRRERSDNSKRHAVQRAGRTGRKERLE